MEITLAEGEFKVLSDSMNFILQERYWSKKGEKYLYRDIGYYGTLEGLLRRLGKEKLYHSEAKTLEELQVTLKEVGCELKIATKHLATVWDLRKLEAANSPKNSSSKK